MASVLAVSVRLETSGVPCAVAVTEPIEVAQSIDMNNMNLMLQT